MTHWIYPVNPHGDYYLILDGKRVEVSIENVLKAAKTGARDWWHVSRGHVSIRRDDLVWVCFTDLGQLRVLARATGAVRSASGDSQVQLAWNEAITRRLQREPIGKDIFGRIPQNAMWRAKPGVANVLDRWLGTASPVAAPGFDPSTAEDNRRLVDALIVQREGQKKFRDALLAVYRRCAVTGTEVREVLEAAHIYPYIGPDSSSVPNGILLRSDIHLLFDRGLLCVDDELRVIVHPSLRRGMYGQFHGAKLRVPKRRADRPSRELLRQHRSTASPWLTDNSL
jgi:hypothetical protein